MQKQESKGNSKRLYYYCIKIERIRELINKYGIGFLISCVFLGAVVKKFSMDKYSLMIKFMAYYFYAIFLLLIIIGIILYFLRAAFFFIYTRSEEEQSNVSLHEAGHALVAELLFPWSNKQTFISYGLFGCFEGAKYNATGMNLIDIDRLDTYKWSNRCTELEFLRKKMLISLAGFVAELLSQNPSVIVRIFEDRNKNPISDSDFEKCNQLSLEILRYTGQNPDNILRDSIIEVNHILYDNRVALAHLYNILKLNRKIKGTIVARIVREYGKQDVYSYKKFSRLTYLRVKLISIISKQSTVNLAISTAHEICRAICQAVNNYHELKSLIQANPRKIHSPKFIAFMLLFIICLVSYIWLFEWLFRI